MTDAVIRSAGLEVIVTAATSTLYERTDGLEVLRQHEAVIQYIRTAGLEALCNHVKPIQYIRTAGLEVIYGEAPNERYGPGTLTTPESVVHGTGLRGAPPLVGPASFTSPVSRLSAYGLTGQVIVQATYSHAAGQIAAIGALTMRDLGNAPTVVEVTYTNTTTTPWSQATAVASLPGVGTTRPRRVSSVSLLGIQRYSQAMREAIERLNKLNLGNLTTTIDVFDEGIRHDIGDLIAVDFPALGLVNKAFRVTSAPQMSKVGRWRLDLAEHDPAAYSNLVQTADSTPDTVRVIAEGPPGNVLGLNKSILLGNITLSWFGSADSNYSHTIVKVGGTDWYSGSEIFGGRSTVFVLPIFSTGTYIFRAKHVSKSGAESPDAAVVTAEVTDAFLLRGESGAPGAIGSDGEDGEDGQDGQDGADGEDGVNAFWPVLSRSSMVFPADSSGAITSYSNASTSLTVVRGSPGGSIDETSLWTYSVVSTSGLVVALANNVATVQSMSVSLDSASFEIVATRSGYNQIRMAVSVSKSKNGANGTNGSRGSDGANGTRGSVETYRNTSGSTWSDSDAATALVALGITTGPIRGDRVTLQNVSFGYVESRYFNGSSWIAWQARVDGNLLVTGSVGAAALNADEVFSLRLNIADKFIVGGDGIARFKNADDRTLNLGATGNEYVIQVEDVFGIEADGDSYFAGRLRGATGEFSGTLSAGVLDQAAFDGMTMPAYATPGTFTLTAPNKKDGWSRMDMRVVVVGGGGGGGGGFSRVAAYSAVFTGSSGAGGGAGERRSFIINNIADGEQFTINIGAGGDPGVGATPVGSEYAVATNGKIGERTSVTRNSTMVEIAAASPGNGGEGGRYSYVAQPGTSGGNAGALVPTSAGLQTPYYNNYNYRANYANATPNGGKGGDSYYMPGGLGGTYLSMQGRNGATGSGGGGGGLNQDNGMGEGGSGGPGWVEITFFSGSLLTPADRHNALVDWCETFGFGVAPTGVRV